MAAALKSLFDAKHPGDQCTNCGHVVVRTPLKACMAALKQPCEHCGRRAERAAVAFGAGKAAWLPKAATPICCGCAEHCDEDERETCRACGKVFCCGCMAGRTQKVAGYGGDPQPVCTGCNRQLDADELTVVTLSPDLLGTGEPFEELIRALIDTAAPKARRPRVFIAETAPGTGTCIRLSHRSKRGAPDAPPASRSEATPAIKDFTVEARWEGVGAGPNDDVCAFREQWCLFWRRLAAERHGPTFDEAHAGGGDPGGFFAEAASAAVPPVQITVKQPLTHAGAASCVQKRFSVLAAVVESVVAALAAEKGAACRVSREESMRGVCPKCLCSQNFPKGWQSGATACGGCGQAFEYHMADPRGEGKRAWVHQHRHLEVVHRGRVLGPPNSMHVSSELKLLQHELAVVFDEWLVRASCALTGHAPYCDGSCENRACALPYRCPARRLDAEVSWTDGGKSYRVATATNATSGTLWIEGTEFSFSSVQERQSTRSLHFREQTTDRPVPIPTDTSEYERLRQLLNEANIPLAEVRSAAKSR